MGLVNLNISPRSTKGKNANRRTRVAGKVPAVVYGKGQESEMVELDAMEFKQAMINAGGGGSAIFKVNGDAENIALLREIQTNPVTDQVLHVDLMTIPRGVPVTVTVSLNFIGTPIGVKADGGNMAISLSTVDLLVRPSQLPDNIEVDVSEMLLNEKLFVKDITTEVGEIVSDPEGLVLNIKPAIIFVEEVDEDLEGLEGEEGEEGEGGGEGEEGKDADAKADDKSSEGKKDKKD